MVRSFEELPGDENPSTAAYMAEEHLSTAYATQVAYAIWGADAVVKVQYRVSRQNVIPYKDRNDPSAQRPDPTFSTTGWRLPIEEEGQSRENFANTFRGQFERIQP